MSAVEPSQPQYPSVPQQQYRPMVAPEFKSISTMWLLWLFLGGVSAHEFYMGRIGIAFLRLFTAQYLGVGLIIDLFLNTARVRRYNEQVALLTGVASPTAVVIKA